MDITEPTLRLTHRGAMRMIEAAIARAEAIGQPQCIAIVDPSGVPLAEVRMTGAKLLSRQSARAKALTSASHAIPSDQLPEAVRPAVAAATGGALTGLGGGLPIAIKGTHLGGIGVGSGTPEQDLDVCRAALAAIGADPV